LPDVAYKAVNREKMYSFFLRLKHKNGGFRMHDDGEVDVRGTYTVLAVAKLLNITTPELTEGTVGFLLSCQTYEGGFGGEPGNEAHGGYAFCAIAALKILDSLQLCDVGTLKHWLANRQMSFEGGFSGRSNKLVDGCYSFWIGASVAIVGQEGRNTDDDDDDEDKSEKKEERYPFDFASDELQRYILLAGQNIEGGLRDKPSKMRDYYHSCYCLSGLSVAQHSASSSTNRYADENNTVAETDVVLNIRVAAVNACLAHFQGK
jgi:protein farnesyltransferase subunit beta